MVLFYLIGVGTFLFSFMVRQKLKATYEKLRRVPNQVGLTGAQVARRILDANRLQRVRVETVPTQLGDHYDPRGPTIRLSESNARSASIAAMAVSAHEAGHALQDAEDYGPLEARAALAPVAQTLARFGFPVAIFGTFSGIRWLVPVGMLAYLGALLIQFLTLPVEYDASRRALSQLSKLGMATGEEQEKARQTLRAAAMTYVAGVASAAGFVFYLGFRGVIWFFRRLKLPGV